MKKIKTRIKNTRIMIRTTASATRSKMKKKVQNIKDKKSIKKIRKKVKTNVQKIKQKKPIKKIPTVLTFFNVALGFIALLTIYSEQYLVTVLLIVIAFVFDILDGFMARYLEVTSAFGLELDSLADAVTFVIAPSLLLYFKFFSTPRIGIVVATFAVICGIARLAKFNVTADKSSFIGMPTPFFALLVISFVFLDVKLPEEWAALVFFILALLMISPVKYPNFKDPATKKYRLRGAFALSIFAGVMFLPIELLSKAIASNVIFWVLLFLPLCFDKVIKKHKFVIFFGAGLILATVAFAGNTKFLLVLPALYSVIAGPLFQMALTQEGNAW